MVDGYSPSNQPIDITGARFGNLLVIACAGTFRKGSGPHWLCECDCGNQKNIHGSSLRGGLTKSCGCKSGGAIDLAGRRFGHLVVLYRNGKSKQNEAMWQCQCDCGAQKNIRGQTLRVGGAHSCGLCNHVRELAIANGSTHYLSNSACVRGHFTLKSVATYRCIECDRLRSRQKVTNLANHYLKGLLALSLGVSRDTVPITLLVMKREQLDLHRTIKEVRNVIKDKRRSIKETPNIKIKTK